MKNIYTAKNLFEYFNEYEKGDILFAVSTLEKEKLSLTLIKKQFGENFDGKGRVIDIPYYQRMQIENILNRIEKILKYIKIQKENGVLFDMIKEKVLKNDIKVDTNAPIKKEIIIKTKEDILNKYNVTEDALKDALDYVIDTDKRLAFQYYYGIGRKKLEKDRILLMLNVSSKEFDHLILDVKNLLPNLLKGDNNIEIEPKKEEQKEVKKEETILDDEKINNIISSLTREEQKLVYTKLKEQFENKAFVKVKI